MVKFYTYLWLRADGSPYYAEDPWKRAHRKNAPPEDRIIIQDWPSEEQEEKKHGRK